MTDDIEDIATYYTSDIEREHARLESHQLEYDLTAVDLSTALIVRSRERLAKEKQE